MDDAFFRTTNEVLEYFGTNQQTGLTQAQVEEHRTRFGRNELPAGTQTSWLILILKQFEDQLVIILLGSAIVSFVLGLLEAESSFVEAFIEPAVILLILIANAIVGVYQESSAEEAIERLKEYEAKKAVVIRDGKKSTVESSEVVPGDLLYLSVGKKIPADCRMIAMESHVVQTDESMLTGESDSQMKDTTPLKNEDDKLAKNIVDQEKSNTLFSGTLMVSGRCRAVAVLTGERTSLGTIQGDLLETDEDKNKTPLGEKLDDFAEFLSKVILAICVTVWLININHFKEHGGYFSGAIYYFKISVSLAVAAIPEGLPAVVTTCLALGTMKMAKKNVIVRSLPSVETLGTCTVVCSDKTGTLTTNQMSVQRIMTIQRVDEHANEITPMQFEVEGDTFEPKGKVYSVSSSSGNTELHFPSSIESLKLVGKISTLCNESSIHYGRDASGLLHWSITGESTEGALKVMAEKLGVPDPERARENLEMESIHKSDAVDKYWNGEYHREELLEFTRQRKSMSVIMRKNSTQEGLLLCKGAPEMLLERCSMVFCNEDDGHEVALTDGLRHRINEAVHDYMAHGLRVLGLAYKKYESDSKLDVSADTNYQEIESDMTFVGVTCMLDPPRDGVETAIGLCNRAGIRVIVITGDNKKTAEAICRRIGLFGPDEHDLAGKSFLGADFSSLSEEKQMEVIRDATLFSRVMPHHKMEIVKLLKNHGEVVAMTGDGVNDAIALAKADIGIGMGGGTDVAKQASDMILLDDNFSTIVAAVEEGRAIYANTKQFIRYLISSNIGEVACIFLTAALGLPESLIPVQLLWVNLVTDGLPATALGFNEPDDDIMAIPPRGRDEKIIGGWMFVRYFLIGMYVGIATVLGFVWWFVFYQDGPQLSYAQLTHFHSCNAVAAGGGSQAAQALFGKDAFHVDAKWNGCDIFVSSPACTISLSILVTIEMFNTFNALSENQSLLRVPPWANIWVVLAVALSMFLHCGILYIAFFAGIFKTHPLNFDEWMAVLAFSFPVILLDEVLKFISRRLEIRTTSESKKEE